VQRARGPAREYYAVRPAGDVKMTQYRLPRIGQARVGSLAAGVLIGRAGQALLRRVRPFPPAVMCDIEDMATNVPFSKQAYFPSRQDMT
jgi:hypothetical protein